MIESLGVNAFSDLYEILTPDPDQDDSDDSDSNAIPDLKSAVYEALGKSWPVDERIQEDYMHRLCQYYSEKLSNSSWKIQSVILKSLSVVFER